MRTALFVLVVTACSNLPEYHEACGNGVIEPHEDCDSSANCFQCARPCQVSADCPVGLACGGDFLCHAPGGQFRAASESLPFDGLSVFVSDVDADRVGDLVTVGTTTLTVDHSQLAIGPVTQTVLQTPFVTGPPAIGSFDASDQTNDVVLPTAHGLVAYTSTQRALSPYPFALDVSPPVPHEKARPDQVFPLDGGHLGLVGQITKLDMNGMPVSSELDYITITILGLMPTFSTATPICPSLAPDGVLGVVARAVNATQTMVAISGKTEGCVLRIDGTGSGMTTSYTLGYQTELPTGAARLVLAPINNAACPSVIAGQTEYAPTTASGSCVMAGTAAPLAQLAMVADPTDIAIGTVKLDPPVPNYGADALVLTHGIYAVSSSAAEIIYGSDRALTDVVSLDIDGDGDLDAVAINSEQNDLDVLFRFEPGPPPMGVPPIQFQLLRYDTIAHPRLMLPGDYDGNHISDLAYSERVPYGERLLVMYGTPDRPVAPVEMATFRELVTLLPGNIDPADPSQTLEDLSVLDFDEATLRPLLTLMHGSPQRTLYPALEPGLVNAPTSGPEPPFVGVAMGQFAGINSVADLFSVSEDTTGVTAWLSVAQAGAFMVGLQPALDNTAGELQACGSGSGSSVGAAGILCADSAHYLTWHLASGLDTLIGVDDAGHAATFSPASGKLQLTADAGIVPAAPVQTFVHSLHQIDLDGDGEPELVVALGADPKLHVATEHGAVLAYSVDASGVVIAGSRVDLGQLVQDTEGDATCVDAAVGNVTEVQVATYAAMTAPPPSLLMLCHRSAASSSDVYRVFHDASGYHVHRVARMSSATVERIFVGDINGDVVDDLIALDVGSLLSTLTIYPQCTSRDADTECTRSLDDVVVPQ